MTSPNGNGHTPITPVNHGELQAIVWPTYIGLGHSNDDMMFDEFVGDPDYDRGLITWVTRQDSSVYGHGRVYAPKGTYTHFIFAYGPTENVCGVRKSEHPIVFDRAGWVDVDPIENQDVLPRGT
jgi:hypothetical protein